MTNFVSPKQIQIQIGLVLLVWPDTHEDMSQPWFVCWSIDTYRVTGGLAQTLNSGLSVAQLTKVAALTVHFIYSIGISSPTATPLSG